MVACFSGKIIQEKMTRITRPGSVKLHLPSFRKPFPIRGILSTLSMTKKSVSIKTPNLTKLHMERLINRISRRMRFRREVVDMPHIEVVQWGNDQFGNNWPSRIKNNVLKKMPKVPEPPVKPMRRQNAVRRRTPSPTYSHGMSAPHQREN